MLHLLSLLQLRVLLEQLFLLRVVSFVFLLFVFVFVFLIFFCSCLFLSFLFLFYVLADPLYIWEITHY